MKKLLIMLLVLALALGTCFAESEQTVYQHAFTGFSFTFPAGWELESEAENGCIMLGHDGQLIVVVERTDIGMAVSHEDFLSVYAPMLLDTYAQEYSGMETLQDGEIVSVGDHEYVQQVIAMEMEGVPVTMLLNYHMAGTCMYIIGFTVQDAIDETKLDLVADEVDVVLSSFTPAGGDVSANENVSASGEATAAAEAAFQVDAEMKEEALTYTNERGGYTFSFPADMLLMSQDNVQDMLDAMTSEDYAMEGLDPTALQQNAAQIRQTDMAMLMYAGGVFNYNVVYQNTGILLNNELVLSALCPSFITQYQAIYPGLEMLDEGSMYTVGDKEYVTQSLQVNVNGMDMTIVVLYAVNGTYLYNITFTVADMVMTDDMTDYVNGTVALFAESFEAFAPTAQ